ncbi:MAG TPA: HEAT repeat domain-containing protein [Sphingobacteriaceae bacterium]
MFHAGLFIFLRRVKQSIDARRDARYGEIISNMLAHIILYDEPGDAEQAVEHFVPRFEKLPLKIAPVRELLVRELLDYHSNFTGRTADILKGIYLGLRLDHYARKKIRSCYWERQVEGIRELTQLWIRRDADMILKLGNSKNPTLRMEAQTSFVKLSSNDSFRFLDEARETILEWHQVVLFEVITKTRNVRIPSFGKWLSSPNDSVVILCLKLIDHYQQLDTIPQLIGLLQHRAVQVQEKAIRVLGKLEAETAEPYLYDLYPRSAVEVQAAILKAMGRIASGNYLEFLTGQAEAEDYGIRMAAMRSIREHGLRGAELLQSLFGQATLQNKAIINHVFDTRIKV